MFHTFKSIVILIYLTSFCLNCRGENCHETDDSCRIKREDKKDIVGKSPRMNLWHIPTSTNSSIRCRTGKALNVKSLQCFATSGVVPCNKPLAVGTLVSFTCPNLYHADSTISMCQHDGMWSEPIKCTADCGIIASEGVVPLIMHGTQVEPGQWPWAAALYRFVNNNWHYSCGGTLISNNAIVTAAHCAWNFVTKNMKVVLGHLPRSMPKEDQNNLTHQVKRVYLLPVYRHDLNAYNSDIAVLILQTPAKLSKDVLPACLPQKNTTVRPYISSIVAGWGTNEKRKDAKSLHYIRVPIIDMLKCLRHIPERFTKYLSYTSFCAGYLNGTGACNGDSGNGLLTQEGDRWTLQGVVSTSPRKGTSKYCHPRNYSLYTKVRIYVEWILKVISFEENEAVKNPKNRKL